MKKLFCFLMALALLCPAALAGSIPLNEKAYADMDGDGADENITLKMEGVPGEEYLALYLFGADGSFNTHEMYVSDLVDAFVQDIDGDGLLELLVTCDYYSDDYVTYCFNYTEDGGMTALQFEGVSRGDDAEPFTIEGYGRITAMDGASLTLVGARDVLGTWMASRVFTLKEGRFVLDDDGLYRMACTEEDWEYRPLILKVPLEVSLPDGSAGVFPAGTQFLPTASDGRSIVHLITRDGVECSVKIEPNTKTGWGSLIGGMEEEYVFEYIPYAD